MTSGTRFLIKSLMRDWPAYLIVAAMAGVQVYLATRPFDFLITNVLPDDAFYYFKLAGHLAQGAVPSFDGTHLTNGFHPLWLLVLVPIFAPFAGAASLTPVYHVLGLSVVMNVITALVVFATIARFTQSRFVRAFALMLWCLNPFLILESMNGLETSLSLLLASSFFLCALALEDTGRARGYLLLGALAGLMILARLDLAFYLAAFLAWMILRNRKDAARVKRALLAGLVATLVVLPWFAWNYSHFGMIFTTSASNANTLVTKTLIVQDNGDSVFQWGKAIAYDVDYQVRLLLLHTGSAAFVLMLMGAVAVLANQRMLGIPRRLNQVSAAQALFIGFVLLFLVEVVGRFVGRSWYFVTVGIFVSLLFAVVVAKLMPRLSYERSVAVLLTAFIVFTFYVSWSKEGRDRYVSQQETYAAALWTNAHLPDDAVVGAFNSGILGYFSERKVVNLDGLVNNSAYDAMREKRLWSYLSAAGVTHIIDYDIYLTYRYKAFFGVPDYMERLALVERLKLLDHSRSTEGIGIYRVANHD